MRQRRRYGGKVTAGIPGAGHGANRGAGGIEGPAGERAPYQRSLPQFSAALQRLFEAAEAANDPQIAPDGDADALGDDPLEHGAGGSCELPRTNLSSDAPGFASQAGAFFGRNPAAVAVVVLGGAAAAVTGTAGAALGATLDTQLPPDNAGTGPIDLGAVGNDPNAPVLLAQNVLFGSSVAAVSAANDAPVLAARIHAGATLQLGDRGPEVRELKDRLAAIGFTTNDTDEFDAATQAQVKTFQRIYGVEQTGRFGATSLELLQAGEAVTEPGRSEVATAYDNGHPVGRIHLVYIDGKPVAADTANALRPMFVAAARGRHPVQLQVVSGFRTFEEQRELYNDYRHHHGNLAARPGYSNHEIGRAVDLNTGDPGVYSWLKRNAHKFGFQRTVRSEAWHWEHLSRFPG